MLRKKHLLMSSMMIVLAFLLTAFAGHAQSTTDWVKVDIPYGFVVGDTTLPPGEYTIRTTDQYDENGMIIENENLDVAVRFLTKPLIGEIAGSEAKIVFNQYDGDDMRYLAQVWVPADSNPRRVLPSDEETGMQKKGMQPTEHSISGSDRPSR